MNYRVLLSRSARKQLEAISGENEVRVMAKLAELEANPRPSGCKKLANRDGWRVRSVIIGSFTKFTTKFYMSLWLPLAIGGRFIGDK